MLCVCVARLLSHSRDLASSSTPGSSCQGRLLPYHPCRQGRVRKWRIEQDDVRVVVSEDGCGRRVGDARNVGEESRTEKKMEIICNRRGVEKRKTRIEARRRLDATAKGELDETERACGASSNPQVGVEETTRDDRGERWMRRTTEDKRGGRRLRPAEYNQ